MGKYFNYIKDNRSRTAFQPFTYTPSHNWNNGKYGSIVRGSLGSCNEYYFNECGSIDDKTPIPSILVCDGVIGYYLTQKFNNELERDKIGGYLANAIHRAEIDSLYNETDDKEMLVQELIKHRAEEIKKIDSSKALYDYISQEEAEELQRIADAYIKRLSNKIAELHPLTELNDIQRSKLDSLCSGLKEIKCIDKSMDFNTFRSYVDAKDFSFINASKTDKLAIIYFIHLSIYQNNIGWYNEALKLIGATTKQCSDARNDKASKKIKDMLSGL